MIRGFRGQSFGHVSDEVERLIVMIKYMELPQTIMVIVPTQECKKNFMGFILEEAEMQHLSATRRRADFIQFHNGSSIYIRTSTEAEISVRGKHLDFLEVDSDVEWTREKELNIEPALVPQR